MNLAEDRTWPNFQKATTLQSEMISYGPASQQDLLNQQLTATLTKAYIANKGQNKS